MERKDLAQCLQNYFIGSLSFCNWKQSAVAGHASGRRIIIFSHFCQYLPSCKSENLITEGSKEINVLVPDVRLM
jgi:hypothetical protein